MVILQTKCKGVFMHLYSRADDQEWKTVTSAEGSTAFLQPDRSLFNSTSSIHFMCLNKELRYPAQAPEDSLEAL